MKQNNLSEKNHKLYFDNLYEDSDNYVEPKISCEKFNQQKNSSLKNFKTSKIKNFKK